MTGPIIAVTVWRRAVPTVLGARTDLYTLGGEYADSVQAAGGIPVLVPDVVEPDAVALLQRVDGLLLSGGQDVASGPRDATESALLGEAQRLGMPVFGICRGLQVLNVHRGGTLVDDLPHTPDHPAVGRGEERLSRHRIVDAAGWVADSLPDDGIVNSIHHQAIDRLGAGLSIAARADDGTVEAVAGTDASRFLRAVQWHPEKMPGPDGRAHATRLLAPFIAAADSYRRRPAAIQQRKEFV
ncbi:gamma-glutamyl-gamma-aminobutyrate hydrolase family protein [Leifsonia sp. ZF2019]|uniref:gamma-glutamyl-gamma-aminobutyrate hydrolase family protein n=1 Tax=Leifsonia sp. ZF2019 TaxID=2781978 RepID=UPI001CBC32AB|nr:gamma-glutamyl-gamma-aminobutyrate hydrolase family protein [Leifsonia sp. ZF2019]UAJ78700.1 gamma-glutamyl-gamma-aminobutyrate hydrolase family protein [Leifsonia sp. ZF2019]